ncbi:MAG: phage tail tube protein [Acidimicrobiia bacterium]
MANRDSYVGFGREASAYGTRQAPTRSFEAEADPAKVEMQHLDRTGLRAGRHTRRAAEVRTTVIGATGSFPLTVMQTGFGMLFRAMLDTAAIAQVGATAAYLQTFNSAQEFNGESLTMQVVRGKAGGTKCFEYPGTTIHGWTLEQQRDAYLKLTVEHNSQDEDLGQSAAAAVYPAAAVEFAWPDLVVTLGGTPVDVRSFKLTADRGLDVARRRLRGSRLKKVPVRIADPSYMVDLELDYTEETYYDLVRSGATLAVVATWTGATEIDTNEFPYLKATMAAVQLRGDTPQVDPAGAEPTLTLSGPVLHDDSNVAVKLEYQSSDTAH